MHKLLVNPLLKLAQEKVWLSERPAMTIAVDMGRKATKTKKQTVLPVIPKSTQLAVPYSLYQYVDLD